MEGAPAHLIERIGQIAATPMRSGYRRNHVLLCCEGRRVSKDGLPTLVRDDYPLLRARNAAVIVGASKAPSRASM
jgi:hypothetical protein